MEKHRSSVQHRATNWLLGATSPNIFHTQKTKQRPSIAAAGNCLPLLSCVFVNKRVDFQVKTTQTDSIENTASTMSKPWHTTGSIEIKSEIGEFKTMQGLLTNRERDVLCWAAEGKTAWEIGTILSISERTVKFHLSNIYRKLGVSSRTQAVVFAVKNELLETPQHRFPPMQRRSGTV